MYMTQLCIYKMCVHTCIYAVAAIHTWVTHTCVYSVGVHQILCHIHTCAHIWYWIYGVYIQYQICAHVCIWHSIWCTPTDIHQICAHVCIWHSCVYMKGMYIYVYMKCMYIHVYMNHVHIVCVCVKYLKIACVVLALAAIHTCVTHTNVYWIDVHVCISHYYKYTKYVYIHVYMTYVHIVCVCIKYVEIACVVPGTCSYTHMRHTHICILNICTYMDTTLL